LLSVETPLFIDEHRLAGRHVAHHIETQHIERHALGGQHPFGAFVAVALADHQRPDAVGIAKPQNAMADHHGCHGIAAPAAPVHRVGRRKYVRRRHPRRSNPLELGGQDIEKYFGIGTGI
jgi:hypothetical protein